jgi:hypothetical protein
VLPQPSAHSTSAETAIEASNNFIHEAQAKAMPQEYPAHARKNNERNRAALRVA